MSRKIVFLFIALLLPILIFLFLKRFGKNQFEIPVYYTMSADSLNTICHTHYSSPYAVPDSSLNALSWTNKKAMIVVFGTSVDKELNRIPDTFDKGDFEIILVQDKIKQTSAYQRINKCVFFITPPKDIVLVDQKKRIRGYYGVSRDEIDRLIVELKILLKQY
jgi:hypothetical protein